MVLSNQTPTQRPLPHHPASNLNSAVSSKSATPEPPATDDEGDEFITLSESDSSLGDSSRESSVRPPTVRPRPRQPIDDVPTEVMITILSKLSAPQDLFSCLLVCKFWAGCTIELLWHRPLLTSFGKFETVVRSLQHESAYWPYYTLIKRLNLSNIASQVNDGSLEPLTRCKKIERLTLTSCSKLTDSGVMQLLEGNRGLLALDITGIRHITDLTIHALARNCPKLQGLNITSCQMVTDDSMVPLAKACRAMKRLKLNKCVLITDDSIETFARHCPSMLEIDLQDCRLISDLSVNLLLSSGRQLRELRLASCHEITDNAFLALPLECRFESLRILDLTACAQLTDAAVERIIHCAPRLRILVLAKCVELTDNAVLAITKLGKNLHDIHLGRCAQISDHALTQLITHCNRIRYIDLAGCVHLSDQSVMLLNQLPKLRRVGLVKCLHITNRSIEALASPPPPRDPRDMILARPMYHGREPNSRPRVLSNLERVHLSYCTNIKVEAVRNLLLSCPKITHLSLTGITAFYEREDITRFCREAPPEFTDDQRNVFCVFSGDGVNKLREFMMRDVEGTRDRRQLPTGLPPAWHTADPNQPQTPALAPDPGMPSAFQVGVDEDLDADDGDGDGATVVGMMQSMNTNMDEDED